MVFGGTKIGGASNIMQTQAKNLTAAEVADKITGGVDAKQARETLETVAGKLLNGKQLAIHHRTSSKTPRFIRQSQVSTERATHTVAVVRNLFAKAGEQIADPAMQSALQQEVESYLNTPNLAIEGKRLDILVKQLQEAIAAGKPPQLDGQASMAQPNLDQPNLHQQNSEALQLAQPEPEQQAIVPAEPQGPDMPGEPAPQPTSDKLADELQGLKDAAKGRQASLRLPGLGSIPVPSITLPSGAGKIDHEAQLNKESGPLLPAESGPINRDIELNEEYQVSDEAEAQQIEDELLEDAQPEVRSRMSIDASSRAEAQEPVADPDAMQELYSSRVIEDQPYLFGQGQSFEAFNRLSGEQLYQRLSGDQDYQVFMGNDDYADDFDHSRPLSLRDQNFEIDPDFDPEAMNPKPEASEQLDQSQQARLIRQDSRLVQDEDLEIFEDSDVDIENDRDEDDGVQRPVDAKSQDIMAILQERQEQAQRDEKWGEFLKQLNDHTGLVANWQSELGLPTEGEPGKLETRPLGRMAGQLRAATWQLKELLTHYMDQPEQQSELRELKAKVEGLVQQLNGGLDELESSRDTLESAMKPFDGDLESESEELQLYEKGLALSSQVIDDADALITASQAVMGDPDPGEIAERQKRYLGDVLNYPDTELNESKASFARLDLQGMSQQQEQLRNFVAVKPFNPQNGPTAFRIREEMKEVGANLSRLQSQLNDVQEQLSDASTYIKEDFGTTSEASKRMQAQVDKRLQEVRQLSEQVNATVASIQQDLKLRAVLPRRVVAESSTPTNPQLAELSKGLLQTKSSGDPTANMVDYESKVNKLLEALRGQTSLNPYQTNQLKDLLKPKGQIANQFTDLKDLLVSSITTERDRIINKVFADHAKRAGDAQRLAKEATRKKEAIQESLQARIQSQENLRSQIGVLKLDQETLGSYLELQEELNSLTADDMKRDVLESRIQRQIDTHKGIQGLLALLRTGDLELIRDALDQSSQAVDELQAQLNAQIYGGTLTDTRDMSPEAAELATWATMSLDELEAELQAQNMVAQNAQADELSATKERDRTLAKTRGEAERKVAEVTDSVEYRLQELEQAHAQL